MDTLKPLLSKEMQSLCDFLSSLRTSQGEWKYQFMPETEFSQITDLFVSSRTYWKEMLYRAHIITLVSVFKSLRWLDALDKALGNYYGFCSSLRCLIESIADSFYTLRSFPLTIARDFAAIHASIHSDSPIILDHGPLEATLLHYIQATKLSKSQKQQLPFEFNAKQTKEYLSSISDGNEHITDLYAYLCGVAHPAYEATQIFLFLHEGETIVCSDSEKRESVLIRDLMNENSDSLTQLLQLFVENIMTVLELLNHFDLKEVSTDLQSNIEQLPAWSQVTALMQESRISYQNALKTNVYE